MYICFFEGESMGRRFDDPAEMGTAITEFLHSNPGKQVKAQLYV
ncbi:MAG: hypothetical protein AWU57_353 [Marinobacter sp. T13-3]|nr:MAG: hypothetical protein AWU57_353 [Marinobacter sp. T13-3]